MKMKTLLKFSIMASLLVSCGTVGSNYHTTVTERLFRTDGSLESESISDEAITHNVQQILSKIEEAGFKGAITVKSVDADGSSLEYTVTLGQDVKGMDSTDIAGKALDLAQTTTQTLAPLAGQLFGARAAATPSPSPIPTVTIPPGGIADVVGWLRSQGINLPSSQE